MAGQTKGNAATRWVLVGAPLDCSGTDRDEARAPGALRDAGLAERTGVRDAGDVDATVDDPNRDVRTGVVGFEQIRRASSEIDSAVAEVLDEGGKPLAVGGDCAVLWERSPPSDGSGAWGWSSWTAISTTLAARRPLRARRPKWIWHS